MYLYVEYRFSEPVNFFESIWLAAVGGPLKGGGRNVARGDRSNLQNSIKNTRVRGLGVTSEVETGRDVRVKNKKFTVVGETSVRNIGCVLDQVVSADYIHNGHGMRT